MCSCYDEGYDDGYDNGYDDGSLEMKKAIKDEFTHLYGNWNHASEFLEEVLIPAIIKSPSLFLLTQDIFNKSGLSLTK